MRFELQHVEVMPQKLQPGILYVSLEFETAHHLCACGCGQKVRTPLSAAEWQVEETPQGVTLRPSIGSWQLPCRSHYLIHKGQVVWAEQWSDSQIAAGRTRDQQKLQTYLDSRRHKRPSWWNRFLHWLGIRAP
ncbi:MAG: DUF6527 family protein [Burkholderiaceae bacterium]|nr:DUF6527 family protein [Burkholderiaceae bacterium]MDO9235926.1 DUF6527 family protein [Aquabacterium sp.]